MADMYGRRRVSSRPCAYYQQGKCNRVQCNFSHELPNFMPSNGTTSDSVSLQTTPSLATPPNHSQSSSEEAYPTRANGIYKTKTCRFYARGKCTAGDACRWSHLDVPDESDGPDPAFVPGGYKLVHKAYRTLPCARYQATGVCFYGDDCNFIHATPPTTTPSTPPVIPNTPSASATQQPTAPSSPRLAQRAHSTHHSPAIGSLNVATAIRSASLSLALSSPSATVGAVLSAPTRPRELPPPQSQVHYSGVNWSLPTPGTPSKHGAGTPPIFASSPIISGAEWLSHPVGRSNSLQPGPTPTLESGGATNGAQSQGLPPSQMRSPFILTFGEIGPGGLNSAAASPRGLGLNGTSLPSTLGPRLSSPSLGVGSALGTTGIPAVRQKSRLSTTNGIEDEDLDADVETDFPSITYNDLHDLVTEPDEIARLSPELRHGGPLDPVVGRPPLNGGLANYPQAPPPPVPYPSANGSYAPGAFEGDWGHALNMLNAPPNGLYGPPQSVPDQYMNGYPEQDRGNGFRSRRCKYYVYGSRCPSGQNCTFIHDPEAMRPGQAGSFPPTMSPPHRPMGEKHPLYRTRECKYHLAGRCHQEGTCDFKHTGPPGQGREYENWEGFSIKVRDQEVSPLEKTAFRSRPCRWFLKGNCYHGEQCTYSHDIHPNRAPCHFFRNGTGNCIAGDSCRYSHEIFTNGSQQYSDEGDFEQEEQYNSIANGSEATVGLSSHPLSGPSVPKVVSSIYDDTSIEVEQYREPYFVGMAGGNDSLGVQGPRMELVVSEGEDEYDDDDVVFPKTGLSNRNDSTNQDVEKLFASLSVAQ